jgi:uncharacterized Zn-binding protein involved in type VI secretion
MPLIVRLGDPGSHGGEMITAAAKTYAEGKRICRKGDTYDCAIHLPNPIKEPLTTKTYAEGKLIAVDGAITECGATIDATATKTYAE